MMGEKRTTPREVSTPRFASATRGGLDREMDRLLGIRTQNSVGRAKHLTFTDDWNVRDEHGEVRRPGLEHKRIQDPEEKTETESGSADEFTACGGGFKNTETKPG
jgi:hypothetical protein